MLLIELTFGLLVYAGVWFATLCALRANRSGPAYIASWSAVLATCIVWLTILFAIHGRGILQRRGFRKESIKEEVYWVPAKHAAAS